MAVRYWIASSAELWNSTACSGGTCWSTSSGGSGGASIPNNTDDAIFDGNGIGNCANNGYTLNTLQSLDLQTGYTGTLTIATIAICQDIAVSADSTININVSQNLYARGDLTVNGSITGSGTLQADTYLNDPLTVSGSGTFSCGLYKVNAFNSGNNTLNIGSNLKFDCDIEWTSASAVKTLVVDNSGNYDLEFTADVDIQETAGAVNWTKGTGTITISGASTQDINFDGETVEDIVVDKTGGTATLSGNVTTDSLEVTRGTLDIDGQTVTISGSLTSNPVAGAVTIQDTAATGAFSISGNVDLNGTASYAVTWTDCDISALASGTNEAAYTDVSNSNNSSGEDIDASNNCTDSGGNTGWNFAVTETIDVVAGTIALDGATVDVAETENIEVIAGSIALIGATVDAIDLSPAIEVIPGSIQLNGAIVGIDAATIWTEVSPATTTWVEQ